MILFTTTFPRVLGTEREAVISVWSRNLGHLVVIVVEDRKENTYEANLMAQRSRVAEDRLEEVER